MFRVRNLHTIITSNAKEQRTTRRHQSTFFDAEVTSFHLDCG